MLGKTVWVISALGKDKPIRRTVFAQGHLSSRALELKGILLKSTWWVMQKDGEV